MEFQTTEVFIQTWTITTKDSILLVVDPVVINHVVNDRNLSNHNGELNKNSWIHPHKGTICLTHPWTITVTALLKHHVHGLENLLFIVQEVIFLARAADPLPVIFIVDIILLQKKRKIEAILKCHPRDTMQYTMHSLKILTDVAVVIDTLYP